MVGSIRRTLKWVMIRVTLDQKVQEDLYKGMKFKLSSK
jgi:hypothetical protein